MSSLQPFFNLFRFHKLKMLTFFALIVVFFVLLFPYKDLGDFVSAQVSETTQNQVFLQFDDMGFTVLPQPGLSFENVYLESVFTPSLKIGSLVVAPSIRGLLTFKPGVSIFAENFLNGDLSLSTRGGEKSKKDVTKQIIQLNIDHLDLKQITALIDLPVSLHGSVDAESEVTMDPTFDEQPNGKVELKIKKFHLPPSSVPTPIGPLNLPEIRISDLSLKGRLIGGELYIDNFRIGNSKDEINGSIKGKIQMRLSKRGVQVTPRFARYNITINLKTLPSLEKKASLLLSLVDGFLGKFKAPEIGGSRYSFKLSGTNFYSPPRITAVPSK